jgi:hypothetical protein
MGIAHGLLAAAGHQGQRRQGASEQGTPQRRR